jgi:hypothetical protein
MHSRGMLVHCPGRLGAAAAILAAELLRGDGVFTKRALKSAEAVHQFDGVVSHAQIVVPYPHYISELKSPLLTSQREYGCLMCGDALIP